MTSESSSDSPARSEQHDPDSSRNGEPQQESSCSENCESQTLIIPPEVRARQKFGKAFPLPKEPDAKRRRRSSNASFSGNTRGEVDVTPERILSSLRCRPQLGYRFSEQTLSRTIPEPIKTMASLLYNQTLPFMVNKACSAFEESSVVGTDFAEFLSKYVPEMDESALLLKEQDFSSIDVAQLGLCQMIRSYVPDLAAAEARTWSTQGGSTTSFYCPNEHHNEGAARCQWKAHLRWIPESKTYRFTDISSFKDHCEHCLKHKAQFTKPEIDFQERYPPSARQKAMSLLHQLPADETTFTMRRTRCSDDAEAYDTQEILRQLKEQTVDQSVTDLKLDDINNIGIPEDTMQLLKLLSLIKKEDKANVKAFFRPDEKGEMALSVIGFMWPHGASLLATHADTIYCDSIWAAERQGRKVATIVVTDRDNNLRLAAAALMRRETSEAWQLFFSWAKECVPSFSPDCIITDGASCIYSEFKKAIVPEGKNVTHITCWWHKKKTLTRKYGGGSFTKSITGESYCDDFEILQQRRDALEAEIRKKKRVHSIEEIKNMMQEIEEAFDKAFIKLKVFTGGTITNSYAESINSRLRHVGLTTDNNLFEIILRLRGYCKYPRLRQVTLTPANLEALHQLVEDDVIANVSNGVLKEQLQLSRTTEGKCRTVSTKEDKTLVTEEVIVPLGQGYAISRDAVAIVTWNTETGNVHCSCNKLVYRGMPCSHIIHVAKEEKRKIPLRCFNRRFLCQQPNSTIPNRVECEKDSRDEAQDSSSLASAPATEDDCTQVEDLHHPATHTLPPGCENILLSNIFAHNGDEESKSIIATFLAMQSMVLEGLKPLTSYDEVMAILTRWESEIRTKIEQLRGNRNQAFGIMDDATRPNKRDSWKEDPKEVLCLAQERLHTIHQQT